MAKLDLALVVRTVDKATSPLRKIQKAAQEVGRRSGLARFGRGFVATGRAIGRSAVTIGRGLARLGLIAGAATAAVGVLTTRYAKNADTLAKTSDRIGVGVKELQRLRYAFDIGGASAEQTDKALGYFARSIGDAADGTGESVKIFEAMGISLRDTSGELRPMNALLDEVSDAFSNQEDASKKAYAAQMLFGRSGMALINTLNLGKDGFEDLRNEADQYGLIEDEDARNAENFIDAMARMKASLEGVINAIGAELLPVLTPMVEQFAAWMNENRPQIVQKFADVIGFLASSLEFAEPLLVGAATGVAALTAAMIANPVGLAVVAVAALGAAAYSLYQNWDQVEGWLLDTWQSIKDGVDIKGWFDALSDFSLLPVAQGWLSRAASWIHDKWQMILSYVDVQGWLDELAEFNLLESVKKWFSGVIIWLLAEWQSIKGALDIQGWFDALAEFSFLRVVEGWFAGVTEWIARQWAEITDLIPDFIKDELGIGDVAVTGAAAPVEATPSLFDPAEESGRSTGRGRGPAGTGGTTGNANIVVDFRGMPRGVTTETNADSDTDLEVTTGYALPGAAF